MAVVPFQSQTKADESSGADGRPADHSARRGGGRGTSGLALHEGGVFLAGSRAVDYQAAERFRILRARLERSNLKGGEKRVIAVTSAVPEEGKSLIASNLARALALDPRGKTLLIDCDLRKPSVHRYCGIPFSPGLSDALVGNRTVASVIQPVEQGFDVIPSGSPVIDATRAVELPQLPALIDELKKHYRYIVVDCPPALLCPEPLTLSTLVDGTILVVRAWRTQKKLVRDAVQALGRERFLGVIVNDASDSVNDYGYYGYYGYDHRSSGKRGPARGGGASMNPLRFLSAAKNLFKRG